MSKKFNSTGHRLPRNTVRRGPKTIRQKTMGTTPKVNKLSKEDLLKQDFIPAETGNREVTVTIKDKDTHKEVTKSSKAMLYSTVEDLIAKKYKGDMDLLLASENSNAVKLAEAVARQSCYLVFQGPAKKLYAAAGKLVRDSKSYSADQTPTITAEVAFEKAKLMYSIIFSEAELNAVDFDAEKINTGEEEE